jgi:hypothetical protein
VADYSAAGVAALLATLTARAEYKQFTLTVGSTSKIAYPYPPDPTRTWGTATAVFLDHPFVKIRPRGPAPWRLVTWSAVYRSPDKTVPVVGNVAGVGAAVVGQDVYPGVSRTFGPESVACDASDLLMAQGQILQWAQFLFDQHDQRMKQAGRSPAKVP